MARVVAYLHSYPPHRYVGGELSTKFYLEALAEEGHTVKVYTPAVKEERWENEVNIRPISYWVRRDMNSYDVFITHPEIFNTLGGDAVRYARPYIGVVHNLNGNTVRGLQRNEPHLTVCNSQSTLNGMPRGVRSKPKMVIYPPVSTAIKRNDGTGQKVLQVNLSAEKGVETFLGMAAAFPEYGFIALQGGHGIQARIAGKKNINFLPQTKDMNSVYQEAKVFLHGSVLESYGMSLAEATVAGIPSIVRRLPVTVEVMGNAGFYPESESEWKDILRRLMTDDAFYSDAREATINRGEFLESQRTTEARRFVEAVQHFC